MPSSMGRRDSVLSMDAHRLPVTRSENTNDDAAAKLEFTIRPEMVRFVSYCLFWLMCIISIILAKYVVHPILLAGPADGKSCPPFETGEGFDLYTESHLIRVLGYNNICANWDYSPAREIMAVYFPLFEYSLILYVITDYINVLLHWKKGLVSTRCYRTFQWLFLPILVGCALFRLIFVIIAYEDVGGHTFGFLTLQLALFLIASMNVWFVVESKIQYRFLCNCTRELAYAYLFCNFIISGIKICMTGHVVFTSTQLAWAFTPVGNITAGQIIDGIWMVFNAIIPFVLCFIRSRTENPLVFSIDVHPLSCLFTDKEEEELEEEDANLQPGVIVPPHQATNFRTVRHSGNRGGARGSLVGLLKASEPLLMRGKINRPPLEGTHPDYPFENVVFQGGGAKGAVYTGAIQALDELGILPYLKRFAGTSAGTIAALSLALGLDAKQACKEMNDTNISDFFDASKIKYGYNLVTKLGVHPAKKCVMYLEDLLERYTGDKDLTFLGLYQRYGTELCISVSNISRSQAEYFHVNTTPDLPIKIAIRTSMSLPYAWTPMVIGGDMYVDGGIFNNYPLKAFDGWFLSTCKEDGVLTKAIQAKPTLLDEAPELFEFILAMNETMSSSFEKANMKTIGFRVSSENSPDQAAYSSYLTNLESKLFSRSQSNLFSQSQSNLTSTSSSRTQLSIENKSDQVQYQASVQYPSTLLAQSYRKKMDLEAKSLSNAADYEDAYVEMCRWMIINMNDHDGSDLHPQALISTVLMRKLQSSPPQEPLTPSLFGYCSWNEVVASMDSTGKGYVTRTDMARFWGRFGVRHAYMKNRKPTKPITSVPALMGKIMGSMHIVFEENLMRDKDNASRSCTLNTYYVDTYDIKLEKADKAFLAKHGKAAAVEWIKKRAEDLANQDMVSQGAQAGQIESGHLQNGNQCRLLEKSILWATDSSVIADEEMVTETHEEEAVDSAKEVKDEGQKEVKNEKMGDAGRGRKVDREIWDQFLLFRDMVKGGIDIAEGKGGDETGGDLDEGANQEETPPKSQDGNDNKESKRKAIDPPSDHRKALEHLPASFPGHGYLLPPPQAYTRGAYSLVVPYASSEADDAV